MVRSSKKTLNSLSRVSKRIVGLAASGAVGLPLFLGMVTLGGSPVAFGQATPAAAPASLAPVDPAVKRSADDFWHYVQVARYELAAAEADKLSSGQTEPLTVLRAFEAVATERRADLDTYVARWNSIEAIKAPAAKLSETLSAGRLALRADQAYIEDNIRRLVVSERAYQLAVARLRDSGELAVPLMVQYLRSVEQVAYHGSIQRALTDMGKAGLSPLLAATQVKDARTLSILVTVLGDMGYDAATPYLLRLAALPETPAAVRSATAVALGKLRASGNTAPADAFHQLAEAHYYNKALVTADLSNAPVAFVWYWSEDRGLTKIDVPPAIFNELMTMRTTEYALSLDRGKDESLSLWLAANYKRELELPSGATDGTRTAGQPDANYYGYSSGPRYLNDVLERAIKDRDSALALRAVKSLQSIIGQTSLFSRATSTPLTAALSYPDRVVRFEAAYAVGSSLPQQAFPGSDQVVPILSEMVAQTGKPGAIVVAQDEAAVNKLVDGLKAQGYDAVGTTSAGGAVSAAQSIPAVDALVISEDVGLGVVDQVLSATNGSPRLARTPKVILTKTTASPYESRATVDVLVSTTRATEPAAIKEAIEKARARGGSNPLDAEAATQGALRSLSLLKTLATARVPSLDLLAARPTLIGALDDARPEVIKSAGDVLARVGQRDGQVALLAKATATQTPDDLKISLFQSLSTSAKTFGNLLPTDGVAALEKVVESAVNLAVRSAAAEARGALNLPAPEAKNLIVRQARF